MCVCVCVCVCLVAGQNQATCDGMDDMIERFTAQLSCTKTPACNRADCTPTNVLLTGYSLSIELLSCRTPPGMIHTNYTVSVVLSIMMNVLLGVCIEVIHCACCINKTRINQPREPVPHIELPFEYQYSPLHFTNYHHPLCFRSVHKLHLRPLTSYPTVSYPWTPCPVLHSPQVCTYLTVCSLII